MADREEYLNEVTIGERKPHNAKITLQSYDDQWPVMFDREARKIRSVLGDKAIQLEHVGSTSVPGLCAKPVVDILLVVADSSDETAYAPQLEEVGYVLRIREPDWYQHRLFRGNENGINLHVFSEGVSEIQKMILFRNRLRANAEDRELYAKTKRELAKRTWKHVQDYADAKTDIVLQILKYTKQ
jgi:GrpB-like predicted nucleotidyltransferase (UPF0157 family)